MRVGFGGVFTGGVVIQPALEIRGHDRAANELIDSRSHRRRNSHAAAGRRLSLE
jgi:hypothetical protein